MESIPVITGVGLVLCRLYQSQLQVMVVEETHDKVMIGKKQGMRSIPFETFEPQDRTLENTLYRCAREELGMEIKALRMLGVSPVLFRLFPEITEIDIVTRYGIVEYLGNPHQQWVPAAEDTRVVGWMTVDQLYEEPAIRIETRPVLDHFLGFLPCLFQG